MREEQITIAGQTLVICRPDDPESLIDEDRFDEDEFLPYWAELWPSGIALAHHVAAMDLRRKRVLEVGCGLALPSFAAALAGAHVVASDWAAEAIDLLARNAARNGIDLRAEVRDWTATSEPCAVAFDVVLAADVLYEERNAIPLLALLTATLAQDGEALIADPGRRYAPAFFSLAEAVGWAVEHVPIPALAAGGIACLRRPGG